MSKIPEDSGSDLPQENDPSLEQMPVEEPRRAASLTLRQDDIREQRMASMEAANKSLADALRITYRLLQVVMIALVVLFLFSGFQQVNQSESGIRVELGRIRAEQLDPGFQFSLPYPLGEIIKVETGNRTIEIDDSFWPFMRPEDRRRPLDENATGADRLDPTKDGSLLTADSNIAHAQWSVVYSRSRPADFVKNVNGDFEQAIVRAAVERAAVQVAASLTIDELYKPGAVGDGGGQRENSIESRVSRLAQQSLDAMQSGIEINQVILRTTSPPLFVRRDFNQVQNAQSNAGKARDQALGDRSKILNEIAGTASTVLLDLIDAYEDALELDDAAKADEAIALIDRVLQGEITGPQSDILGREYSDILVSGEVSAMMSTAQQYRSSVVQQAQRSAETFKVQLEQFRANPTVFVSGAMVDGLQAFLLRPNVQNFWIPEGTNPFELKITPDPEIAREMERARYERDVEGNERVRLMREILR